MLQRRQIDGFIAVRKQKHHARLPTAPRGRTPQHLTPTERMARKLLTKRGRQRYALRKQVAEPVFGQIKQARGFRQFLLRGLAKVRGEWALVATAHNLLKLRQALAVA